MFGLTLITADMIILRNVWYYYSRYDNITECMVLLQQIRYYYSIENPLSSHFGYQDKFPSRIANKGSDIDN